MTAYYNENDPYPAQWLRNLMKAREIAPGVVDERSIVDVSPKDLAGYDRCHFFAGIAGWDYALRLAGWPEGQSVWTGSCPCQPFSSAGRGAGGADERHLWPAWFWLIRQCRPPIIFGEQVASTAGLAWLDVVFSDLEAAGYSCGSADLPACSLGAPHIRQRLWFVAISESGFRLRKSGSKYGKVEGQERINLHQSGGTSGISGILGHTEVSGSGTGLCHCGQGKKRGIQLTDPSPTGELADSCCQGLQELSRKWNEHEGLTTDSITNPWANLHWLPCRDGKLRPTGVVGDSSSQRVWQKNTLLQRERQNQTSNRKRFRNGIDSASPTNSEPGPTQPFIQPLAHGVPQRVGRLRAYGNAIVPQVAATFIQTVMEILGD